VAGSFYPLDPVELSKTIASLFAQASKVDIFGKLVGLVSPHAGYIYSGQVAATGFKLLEGRSYDLVVVISPSHTAYFDGVSVFPGQAYKTPLGQIEIARDLVEEIALGSNVVKEDNIGHADDGSRGEHALEVQLPFLQIALQKFKLLPLVMGDQSYSVCESLADDLSRVLKDKNALVVASTDLSHFHSSAEAGKMDGMFIQEFENFRPRELANLISSGKSEACGGGPVISLMLYAQRLGSPKAVKLMYDDSATASKDRSNVVGYLSGAVVLG